jgi:hypothetical protein
LTATQKRAQDELSPGLWGILFKAILVLIRAAMDKTELTRSRPPESGSSSAMSYFWASTCDLRLLFFVTDTVLTGDLGLRVLQDALDGKARDEHLDAIQLALKDPGPRTQAFRESAQEFIEMFLSRAVDNFQIYIVEILREVLHRQPRILSSSKQELTLGYVLQFDSIDTLTKDWIEGKVTSLSYEGFDNLEEWCQSRGIPLLVPEGKREQIVELIATRNLIVHNRGIVDERYKKAVSTTKFALRQQRDLVVQDLLSAKELLDYVVNVTDGAIVAKFGLPQVNVRAELNTRSLKKWPRKSVKSQQDQVQKASPPDAEGASS